MGHFQKHPIAMLNNQRVYHLFCKILNVLWKLVCNLKFSVEE